MVGLCREFLFQIRDIRQVFVHVEIQHALLHTFRLAQVLKADFLVAEQRLEYIRNRELRSRCRPLSALFSVLLRNITVLLLTPFRVRVLGDINGVIYETHPVISRLMLEGVAIEFAISRHEVNDFRRRVRNLDGISFDMSDGKAASLNLMLQVNHEQGSAFGYDVIYVAVVAEGIFKAGARKPEDTIQSYF